MQSIDCKHIMVTENCEKTALNSSLTYRNNKNKEREKRYNILIINILIEKTASNATSIRTRIETTYRPLTPCHSTTSNATSIRTRIETTMLKTNLTPVLTSNATSIRTRIETELKLQIFMLLSIFKCNIHKNKD